jgi:hypothetical protein
MPGKIPLALTSNFPFSQAIVMGLTSGPLALPCIARPTRQPKGTIKARDQLMTEPIDSAAYVYRLSNCTDIHMWGYDGINHQLFNTAKSAVIGSGVQYFFEDDSSKETPHGNHQKNTS